MIHQGSYGTAPQKIRMLNIGCGGRYHPDWVNLDLSAVNDSIREHDLRKPLPFDNDSFYVVYHSHVLEHFGREEGRGLLRECYRVCSRGGIIRIAVPDLERTVRTYLNLLDQLEDDAMNVDLRYDWIMIELLDQVVRTKPGGDMATFIHAAPQELLEYLESRIGKTYRQVRCTSENECGTIKSRIRNYISHPKRIIDAARKLLFLAMAGTFLGREGINAANEVFFRTQGEVHKWMYDRHSLIKLITEVGFVQPRVCEAAESRIRNWSSFNLDTDPEGNAYKPDSLFCEAAKSQ